MTRPAPGASSADPTTRGAPGAGAPARLFFALVPDAVARRSLAALATDVARLTGGRAPREENLHLTLAFLGSVPPARIGELEAIGALAACAAAPFPLTLDAVGAFRAAGVAWAGTAAVPAPLQDVFERLRALLRTAGLPAERRAFHPHVTLARHCVRGLPGAAIAPVGWRVESIVLMASETLAGGPRYRALASWPLAGATPLP